DLARKPLIRVMRADHDAIEIAASAPDLGLKLGVNGTKSVYGAFASRDDRLIGQKDDTVFLVIETPDGRWGIVENPQLIGRADIADFLLERTIAIDEAGLLRDGKTCPLEQARAQMMDSLVEPLGRPDVLDVLEGDVAMQRRALFEHHRKERLREIRRRRQGHP